MEAWKQRVLKHRRRVCLLSAASMSPFSAVSLSGDVSPTRPSGGPLQPMVSIQFVSCYFVVLPPSFVSPKLQVFNQRLIQNFLWMCSWIRLLVSHYADFARDTIHCTSKLPTSTVSSVFSEHTPSKYSSNDSASAYCAAFFVS